MESFEAVSPNLKLIARTPKIIIPQIQVDNTRSNIIEWQGWNIKNLETLGERYAAGMDSERGVYLVSITL